MVCPTPSSGQQENLDPNILELDDARRSLSVMNCRQGKVVEPMFLSGCSTTDTADVIEIASSMKKDELTMKKDELTAARVWLRAGAV